MAVLTQLHFTLVQPQPLVANQGNIFNKESCQTNYYGIFVYMLLWDNVYTYFFTVSMQCEDKHDSCEIVRQQNREKEDLDIFCSIPWSVTNCPKLCLPKCKSSASYGATSTGNYTETYYIYIYIYI